MNNLMKNAMEQAWHKWHGNDVDTPRVSCAFERGFRSALDVLQPELINLIRIMERSNEEELDDIHPPVSSREWFTAINRAKELAAK